MAGPPPDTLLLLPVFDRVEEVLRERARRDGWADPERVVTFSHVVDRLAAHALQHAPRDAWWRGRRFASRCELVVLRRCLLAEAGEAVTDVLGSARLSEIFGRFADECAEGMVDPAELSDFVRERAADTPRLEALAQLFGAYRQALDARGWLAPSDRLRLAHGALDDRLPLPRLLLGVARIDVRDQYDWTARRLALLVRLAERLRDELGPPERVRLVIPYSHDGQHLFHYLEQSLRELEARADAPIEVVFEALEESSDGPPARIAARLFADGAKSGLPDNAVHLRAAPTRTQELRAAARQVRRLLDEGAVPDRIAVALRRPEPTWRDLARALDAHAVPWHYRRGPALADAPLLAYVSEILTAVAEGLPRAAVERILTSAYTPAVSAVDPDPAEAGAGTPEFRVIDTRMVALLRAAGVRDLHTGAADGRSGYATRLTSYLRRIEPTDESGRQDLYAARRLGFERQRTEARAILERVGLLADLGEPRSLRAWTQSLSRLFAHPGFDPREAMGRPPLEDPAAASPARIDRVSAAALGLDQQSWTALQRLLAELGNAPGTDDIVLTPSGFRGALFEAAREISLNPTSGRGAAVRIVPVRQIVGGRFDHVLLLHLNEGEFPLRTRVDPLFRDADRLAFDRWRRERAAGRPVYRAFRIEESPPAGERVPVRRSEEVVLFCLALAAAGRTAHVSWSATDANGRPRLPSLFVDALRRLLDVQAEVEPLEVIPALRRVATRDDLIGLAATSAAIEASGPAESGWLDAIEALAGRARTASIVHRARVERARQLFFERLDRGDRVRHAPLPSCPPDLAAWLGYVATGPGAAWVGSGRFPFDASQPASASRLDAYGQCPARFFFASFLRLRPDDEVDEEMAPMSRGLLVHRAVERFFERLSELALGGVEAVRGPHAEAARDLLAESIELASRELAGEIHLGHRRLLALARRQLVETLFEAFRTATAPRRRREHLPAGPPWVQEWSFGRDGEPEVAIDLGGGLGTILLTGRIDRIDRDANGNVWITDYKTGGLKYHRAMLRDEHLNRRSFQLPLYAAAVRRALPMLSDAPLCAQYFSLRDGRSERLDADGLEPRLGLDVATTDASSPAQSCLFGDEPRAVSEGSDGERPTLVEGLREVVSGIRGGRYPAATRGCGFCEYGDVCRVSRAVQEREV